MSEFQRKLIEALKDKKNSQVNNTINDLSDEKENVGLFKTLSNTFNDIVRSFGNAGDFGGNYASGGGFAQSTINKDIIIVPTAGTAASQNTYSQIDFKFIANTDSRNNLDPSEVKLSLYNWGERVSGSLFDTPVLVVGGSWGNTTWAPNAGYGVGVTDSALAGYVTSETGTGNLIYIKPASSSIIAALFNSTGIDNDSSVRNLTFTAYSGVTPGARPTAGISVTFGGTGQSGNIVFGGASSNTQTNNIRFYSPLTVSNSTVTDTLSLSLTDSGSGSTQHFVGLGNIRSYNLASNSSSFNKGDIFYSGGTGHTHLARLPIGSDNNVLQAGNGTVIWTNSLNVSNVFASTALSSPLLTSPIHLTLQPNADGAIGVQVIASTGATVATFDTTNKRVGIGLTNPNFGLTVAGFSDGIIRAGTAVSTPLLTSGTTLNIRPNVDNIFGVQIQTSTGATFVNFDTSNRRVGIGISNPSVDLDVRSFTGVGGTIRVGTAVSSPFIISQTIRPAIDRTDGVLIQAATGATVATFDTTNRRVGIGLTNPNFGLTVAGFSDGIIRAGTAVSTSLLVGSGNTLIIRPNVDNTFSIQIQTSTGATFVNFDTTNKRVGIGLSNPTYILDVVGDINAAVGQSYRLAGNVVLGPSTLGTGVTLSSLTQVGAITSGTWAGTAITTAYGGIGAQPIVNTGDILVGSGNTWYRLPISTTDNDVLTVNGADPFKVRWAAVPPAAASSVAAKSINDSGSRYLTFVSGPDVSGVGLSTDSDLIYDASTNRLQVGSLTGNGVTIGTAANTISAAGDLTLTSSTNNVTVNNNLSVTGNLIVNGTTTSIGSTITTLLDPVFVLGAGIGGTNPTVDDNKDRGIEFRYFSGTAKTGFFGYDDSTESFTFIPDATNSDEVFSGAAGTARFANVISNLSGNVTGNLTGFADTSNSVRVATTTANAFNPVLFTPSASSTGTAISANSMLVYNPGTDILYSSGIHVTSSTAVDNVVSAPFRINGGLGVSNNIVVVNGIGIGYSYSGHGGIGLSYRAKLFVDQVLGNAGLEIYDGIKSPNNPRILLQIDGPGGNIPGLVFRNSGGSNSSNAAIVGVPDSLTTNELTIWTSQGTLQLQRLNVLGGAGTTFSSEIVFGSKLAGTAFTSTLRGTNASGTNIPSGEFRIIAGRSTGNAANEGVGIYVANPGASSSTLNSETLVTRFLGTGVTIVPNTSSSSVSTGSLVVNGGVGLAGNAFIGGTVTSTNTSASNSVGSGALVLAGGAGIAGTLTVGTRVNVTNSLNSSSSTTGAIINSGGLGLGGNAFIGGTVVILNTSNSTTINSGALEVDGGVGVGLSISIGGRLQLFNGNLYTAFYSTQSGVNTTYILPNTSPSATGTSVLSSTMDGILSWVPMTATGGTSNSIQSNDANANSSHYVLVSPSNTTTGIAVSTDSQLLYNPSTNTLSVSNIFGSGAGVTISNASSLTSNSYLTIQTVAADDSSTTDFFIRGITSGATSKFSVDANGNLRATTKSFDIPHPTKPGKRLVYGVLEGPEHGVYHRGTAEGSGNVTVLLPEYWSDLVGSNYTLQLTPYGNYNVSIFEKNENYFTIQLIGNSLARKYKKYKVDYILHGARKDAPLDIEQ